MAVGDLQKMIDQCLRPEDYTDAPVLQSESSVPAVQSIVSMVPTVHTEIIEKQLPVAQNSLLVITGEQSHKSKKNQVPPKPVVEVDLQKLAAATVLNNDDIGKTKVRHLNIEYQFNICVHYLMIQIF